MKEPSYGDNLKDEWQRIDQAARNLYHAPGYSVRRVLLRAFAQSPVERRTGARQCRHREVCRRV